MCLIIIYLILSEIDTQLQDLIKKVEACSFDYYIKAEGITADNVKNDRVEIRENKKYYF